MVQLLLEQLHRGYFAGTRSAASDRVDGQLALLNFKTCGQGFNLAGVRVIAQSSWKEGPPFEAFLLFATLGKNLNAGETKLLLNKFPFF